MHRRRLFQWLFRILPGSLLVERSMGSPPLIRINTAFLTASFPQSSCTEDICTERDACETGDAGHICEVKDVCEIDESGDCSVDQCSADKSFGCENDDCTSDKSGQCTGDRCLSDSSGDCANDGGPTCPDDYECPEDLCEDDLECEEDLDCYADLPCQDDFAGYCESDASADCTNDACVADASGECSGDVCRADASGDCTGQDLCISDSSGGCENQDVCTADKSGFCSAADECVSDKSGECLEQDTCINDKSAECGSSDMCVSDASGGCEADTCKGDSSKECNGDGCWSDSSWICEKDQCSADASGYCSRDSCISDASGDCLRDVCVLDKSGGCEDDLCREDQSEECSSFDTCAFDVCNTEPVARRSRRALGRATGLNRALRWLYKISAALFVVILASHGRSALGAERVVIDGFATALSPMPTYRTGQTLSLDSDAGHFLFDFDGDGILEADTNGNGLDATDPEVKDWDGDGTRELPPGTSFSGTLEFSYFWIPEDVAIVASGPLQIKVAVDVRVFGVVSLPAGASISSIGVIDTRLSAWLSSDDESSLSFSTALTGAVLDESVIDIGISESEPELGSILDTDQDGVKDAEEGGTDEDQDGIPDWQDQDTARVFPGKIGRVAIDVTEGFDQRLDLSQVRVYTDTDPAVDQNGIPQGPFPLDLIAMKVIGTNESETVPVSIHFPVRIPTTAKFWVYDAAQGWHQIEIESNDGDNNTIWRLADGGEGDRDGEANGEIDALVTVVFSSSYFAQFAEGLDQLISQILLFNLDNQGEASIQIILTDDQGAPLSVDLNGQTVQGKLETKIPPAGLRTFRTDGAGPLAVGSVTVHGDRPIAGVIVFEGNVGVAGVGSSIALPEGFLVPIEKNTLKSISTGVALMNLSDVETTAQLQLCDSDGKGFSSTSVTLARYAHIARFVDEFDWDPPVDLFYFNGLLKVDAPETLAATALQTRPGEFATLPVVEQMVKKSASVAPLALQPAEDTGEQHLYFAHFGEGLGLLFSQIILFNLSETEEAAGSIFLKNDGGTNASIDLNGQVVEGKLEISVPPSGLRVYETDGEGPLTVGSVTVTSDLPLAGVILFGGSVGVAGVGSSQELPNGFTGPVEQDPARQLRTGFAISNLDEGETTLSFELCSADSETLATAQKTLAGKGHVSLFVDELAWNPEIDLDAFQGLLKVNGSGKITAMILQTRPNQFATMPVAPRVVQD